MVGFLSYFSFLSCKNECGCADRLDKRGEIGPSSSYLHEPLTPPFEIVACELF